MLLVKNKIQTKEGQFVPIKKLIPIKIQKASDGKKILTTNNDVADAVIGILPFVGSAMEIDNAIHNPSLKNIGSAAFSTAADVAGLGLFRTGLKAYRLAKAVKNTDKAAKAISESKRGKLLLKVMSKNKYPTPGSRANNKFERSVKELDRMGYWDVLKKHHKANDALYKYNMYEMHIPYTYIGGTVGGIYQDWYQIKKSAEK